MAGIGEETIGINGAGKGAGAALAGAQSEPPQARVPWELFALIGVLVVQCAVVLLGTPPRLAVWLLALLAAGVAQALVLPVTVGAGVGFAVTVAWVLFRQATDTWSTIEPAVMVGEVGLLIASIGLAVRHQQLWSADQQELRELRLLRNLLTTGEVGSGILPHEVAKLRMIEELDRARVFHRPLGLLIIEPVAREEAADCGEQAIEEAHRALRRQLTSASLVHDTPFRGDQMRLGVLLPERDWATLYRDADRLAEMLRRAKFLADDDSLRPVGDCLALHFGLGTYQGEESEEVDLYRAAEDSLEISQVLATMGENRVSAHAMPAAAVGGVTAQVPDSED